MHGERDKKGQKERRQLLAAADKKGDGKSNHTRTCLKEQQQGSALNVLGVHVRMTDL
jgi:hypothetical protein